MNSVSVEVVSKDGLIRWVWWFWFSDHVLWLNQYTESERPTRRHGFKVTQSYSRLNERSSTLGEDDVILPATVKDDALKQFCEGITVKRWGERRK